MNDRALVILNTVNLYNKGVECEFAIVFFLILKFPNSPNSFPRESVGIFLSRDGESSLLTTGN